jgi:acyl-coenzyme A synthetase/AMP-(fatty) acid ligase
MNETAASTANVASAWIDALIASNRGDRHAFAYAEKRYSYQDVAALMNRAANMLRGIGLQPGARVLLLIPGSPALVASLLGSMKSGVVPIVGVPLDDPESARRCVAAASPAAAVVHQDCLSASAGALAGLATKEAVIVVGKDTGGHKSFIDEIRGQSSWSSPEPVGSDAPAIGIWAGSTLHVLSHAELSALIAGPGAGQDPRADSIRPLMEMLRTFSRGETAALP